MYGRRAECIRREYGQVIENNTNIRDEPRPSSTPAARSSIRGSSSGPSRPSAHARRGSSATRPVAAPQENAQPRRRRDRQSGRWGKSGSVSGNQGGRGINKKKDNRTKK